MLGRLVTVVIALAFVGLVGIAGLVGVLGSRPSASERLTPEQIASADEAAYPFAIRPEGRDGPAGGCVVCHSVEKHGPFRVAPNLWGIVGDAKARDVGYGYSLGLAKAGGAWTEGDLDKYLTDPDAFIPGTKKTLVGIPNAETRGEIIAYLKSLSD